MCQSYGANINDRVNTFIVGVNWAVIPKRFDVGLNYTLSMGKDSWPLFMQSGTGPIVSNNFGNKLQAPQFPNVTTTFQRLEANAKYVVDPDLIRSLGWKGEVALRFRYTGEHNPRDQLEQRFMQPYMYETLNQSQVAYYQAVAWNNHNHNVHMIGGRSPGRGNHDASQNGVVQSVSRLAARRFNQRLIYVKGWVMPTGYQDVALAKAA